MPKIFSVKIIFFLSVILIGILFVKTSKESHAQSELEQAKQEYTAQFSVYRDSQERYLNSKSSYEIFKTAVAKTEAFEKTRQYLYQSDALYLIYLNYVQKTSETIAWEKNPDIKKGIDQSIKEETNFLKDHQEKVLSTSILEELPPLAASLKDRLQKTTEFKVYKIIAQYEITQSENILNKLSEISNKVNSEIEAKPEATKSVIFENWQSELANIKTGSESSLSESKLALSKSNGHLLSEHDLKNALESTQIIKDHLTRSINLFNEILRLI